MRRMLVACMALFLIAVAPVGSQAPGAEGTPVVLDVSVVDKNGPITDLRQEEFQIEDDGKKVQLTNLTAVAASGATPADGRDIVLVLDDAGVPMAGTQAIQIISNVFMSNMRPGDTVSVIRLHKAEDDLSKDPQVALARIAAFQAGAIPFFPGETTEDYLKLVTKLSKRWAESNTPRRHAIVCIGSPAVCSPDERDSTAPRDMYPNWVDAVTTTAKANVIAYAAIPGRVAVTGGGLVERSGGEVFAGLNNFEPAVAGVLRDLSQYYLVSYRAPASKKDMRSLTVKVNRKNITVNTRNKRGK